MAEHILNTIIKMKRGTAEDWLNKKDVIPAEGEPCYDLDAHILKIGDGVTTYENLPAIHAGEIPVAASHYEGVRGDGESDMDVIARVIADSEAATAKDDIFVVKALISEGKYSHTAYVYDGAKWVAMDGNYNAENVYFDEDLITSYAMGQIKLTNGAATIPAAGKNLKQIWDAIYLTETKTGLQGTKPSCTISANDVVYLEVGSTLAGQTVTLGLNKGKYDYGYGYVESKDETDPAEGTAAKTVVTNDGTGVVAVSTAPYALTYNGSSVSPKATNGNTFEVPAVTKTTAPSSAALSCTVKYEKAGNPVSNLGNIYPAQAYADATSAAATKTLGCWYYPIYSGFTYTDGAADSADEVVADHANISAARVQKFAATTGKDAYDKVKATAATASKAWRQYFYAFPADYGWVMSGAKDGNNIDCTVKKAADVTLNFSGTDVVYNVYYIHNAADYGTLGITWTI